MSAWLTKMSPDHSIQKEQEYLLQYDLRLIETESATGYFACIPSPDPGVARGLAMLQQRPFDDFLRKHLLKSILSLDAQAFETLSAELLQAGDPALLALLLEAETISEKQEAFPRPADKERLAAATSLIYIKASLRGDLRLHNRWIAVFRENIFQHKPFCELNTSDLPPLFDEQHLPEAATAPRIQDLFDAEGPVSPEREEIPAGQTAELALARLTALKVLQGMEQRHVSSLSPIGLLRKWQMKTVVRSGRNRCRLEGLQTSYGKGLSPQAARASCLMEVVERVSSFASFEGLHLPECRFPYELAVGSCSQLRRDGKEVLDPNRLRLEVPYQDEELHWIEGRNTRGESVYVPVQAVFLFCNLDEISLFSAAGSTGLASGNSMAEAKVSALLEVIERDADAVSPFDPGRCFLLETANPHLAPLFAAYRSKGIHLQFQDITTEFGIPCYRCFVVDEQGRIARGTGAHLDGRRAIMSALNETTYPFPSGPPSAPAPGGLPTIQFEDLPNYDTRSAGRNLRILEALLAGRGFDPVYVDITHRDLDIPVVRTLAGGLELIADFDRFSRVSPRLYANFLRMA